MAVAALGIGGVGTAAALGGSTGGPSAPAVTASPRPATTAPVTPAAPASSAADGPAPALDRIRAQDRRAAEGLVDAWVAQLATQPAGRSVTPGGDDDALAAAVLAGHDAMTRRYPDALLLWSADWNFDGRAWITVLGRRFDTAEAANAWCDSQRLEPGRCFAKRLSRPGPVDGTVRYRG